LGIPAYCGYSERIVNEQGSGMKTDDLDEQVISDWMAADGETRKRALEILMASARSKEGERQPLPPVRRRPTIE
jgi:predicted component of type VI protein secretion system